MPLQPHWAPDPAPAIHTHLPQLLNPLVAHSPRELNEDPLTNAWILMLTLVHDVLLQGLGVMGHRLVQILEQFAHAGHRDAKGLDEEQQLLGLQILQGCRMLTQHPLCKCGVHPSPDPPP